MAEENLWGSTEPPVGQRDYTDGTPINLGMVWKSSINGWVVGARFYRADTAPGGTVTAQLYTLDSETTGTLLATKAYTSPVAGWNEVDFDTPVEVTANTLYVITYHTPDRYVSDWDEFSFADKVNGNHLTGTWHGNPVSNGRFKVGSTAFPDGNGNGAWYGVDLTFSDTDPGGTTTNIDGSLSAAGTASLVLDRTAYLAGTMSAAGTGTAALDRTAYLSGTLSAAGSGSLTLDLTRYLSGALSAAGTATLDALKRTVYLIGQLAGSGTASLVLETDEANATSTPTVTARRTSTPGVTARRTSTPGVSDG